MTSVMPVQCSEHCLSSISRLRRSLTLKLVYIFIESESLTWINYFPSQSVTSYAMPLKTATNFICFLRLAVIKQDYLKNLMMHSYWWSNWKILHSEQQHQQITWKWMQPELTNCQYVRLWEKYVLKSFFFFGKSIFTDINFVFQ